MPTLTDTKFPTDFLWAPPPAPTKLKARRWPTAPARASGIASRIRRAKLPTHCTGDVACDHYRRFADDVRLMRELGIQAYRFSISWSRVLPEGTGRVNRAGLDFYSRLVDTLLEHNIQPIVTLYHWDLPAALEDRGGWANARLPIGSPSTPGTMYRALGDRVRMWATINEPWVVMDHGYVEGEHAPGPP